MTLRQNHSLKEFNSFGVDVPAANFLKVDTVQELREAMVLPIEPKLILGGGSNILFISPVEGLVIFNHIQGIEILDQSSDSVSLRIGGGVVWHELVRWALARDFGGLENLSLIPGTVGAAPIQNIGAYGVEFDQVFLRLHAIEMNSGKTRIFEKADCQFGYRNSIFKQALKGEYVIHHVEIKLTKGKHQINTSYGAIEKQLAGKPSPTIQDISQVVIDIRQSKLPDPATIGNAGSFFKNPVVERDQAMALKGDYPDMPIYEQDVDQIKIPAAWLIEKCGWKGYRKDDAGIYASHALVLVNHKAATGQEIYQLALAVQASVREVFGIALVPEVNIV